MCSGCSLLYNERRRFKSSSLWNATKRQRRSARFEHLAELPNGMCVWRCRRCRAEIRKLFRPKSCACDFAVQEAAGQ